MDCHSYTAQARVRVLLVPLGSLPKDRFHAHAARLSAANEVRLVDVTPTKTAAFNPQGFPSGRVVYDMTTSLDNQESLFLHDFEPFRKTFVVVGITENEHCDDIETHVASLKKLYKSSVLHCAVVFDEGQSSDNVFHCTKQNNSETVMCDLTRLFLDELTAYLSSYQHITLRSPGPLGPTDRSKAIALKKNKRISSGPTDITNAKFLKSSADRRQARIKGRQTKILANLLLLAGKYTDALKEFGEAIAQLKLGNDYLWLGSALEGVGACVLMLQYLDVSYQLPTPVINILFASNSFQSLVSPVATPSASPRSSIATGSQINLGNGNGNGSTTTASKHSTELDNMSVPELIELITTKVLHYYDLSQNDAEDFVPDLVYCESILRYLKFMTVLNIGGGFNDETLHHIVRGKKFTLQNNNDVFDKFEILKLSNRIVALQLKSMDILSQARILTSLASVYGDLGFARKQSFLLRSLFVSLLPQLNQQSSGEVVYNIQDVINTVLSVYGVSLCSEASIADAYSPKWMKLQENIIKICVQVCEGIQDFKNVIALKSLLLTRYLDALTDNEQTKLFHDMQDLSRKHNVPCPYFDPFILRAVHLVKPANPPKKRTKNEIKKHKGPVLYNPYDKTTAVEKNYLVQEEFTEFILVLQNPFAFSITINEVKIEGIEIFKNNFTIAPKSIQKINILTKPHAVGKFQLDSVSLKINNCAPQWFKIAKSQKCTTLQKLKDTHSTSDILSTYTRNLTTNNISGRAETDSLTLDIIPAQPSLQVLNTPEPLMLLEGGTHRLQILLKNNSPVSVNVLDYSVWDSTTEPLKKMLEDKTQPANELYEYEYFFYKKSLKVLSEFTELKPFEEVTLDLEVQGKRGMKSVNLVIDYGHSEGDEVFTRTLDVPITAIVHSSTDLADCDFVPLVQGVESEKHEWWKFINEKEGAVSDWCLFLVDVRNLWNKALSVKLECEGYLTTDSIVPMETKRLLVPIRRIDLDFENLKPIPSLSGKQYIRPKISKGEEQYLKETFWCREEILKKVKGTWSVGATTGELELRGIRLSQRMVNVLKVEKVAIDLTVSGAEKEGVYHKVKTGEFITVEVKITNHSERSVKGIIRNIPTAANYATIERRLLYNGMLQQALSSILEPSSSTTLSIGAVVLERGDYEWGAILDEQGNDFQHLCRTPLRIRAV